MTLLRLRRSCFARTRPSTTGFTNSRWLGLKASERWTWPPDARHDVARVAEVVLHVAAAQEALGVLVVERGEDLAHVLAQDVHEHVQAPAVGHADDDLFDAVRRRPPR